MNTPSLTDITSALTHWCDGDRNAFKAFFMEHPHLLQTYEGPGDPFNFVMPALFVKEFCTDLIDAGFPVEKLFAENLEDFAWIAWKPALDHVARHAPELLIDLAADATPKPSEIYGFALLPAQSSQYLATTEHWPKRLEALVAERAQAFLASNQEELDSLFEHVRATARGPLVSSARQAA